MIEQKWSQTQSIWGDPKPVFEPYQKPKNSSWGAKKIKKEPKVKSKSKVGFEGTIENKSFLMTRVDPLTISDP